MKYKSRRAVSQVVAALIIAVIVILAISFVLLRLSQTTEPPENNVTMTFSTIYASNGVWNGTITVSEPVNLVSILIPTETVEISGIISNINLLAGTNLITASFDGLNPGSYEIIFTFRPSGSTDEVSEFFMVTFN